MSVDAVQPRPAYHHGDLARALLAAADTLIEEQGLESFTLRACARRAGVSHAAPAHHFGDRAGLLSAYATSIFQEMTRETRERIAVTADGYQRLTEVSLCYLRFALRRPGAFRLVFRREALRQDDAELRSAGEECFQVLVDTVRALLPADTGHEDALRYSVMAWSLVHGFAHLCLEGNLLRALRSQQVMLSEQGLARQAECLAAQIFALVRPAFPGAGLDTKKL